MMINNVLLRMMILVKCLLWNKLIDCVRDVSIIQWLKSQRSLGLYEICMRWSAEVVSFTLQSLKKGGTLSNPESAQCPSVVKIQ